MSLHVLAYNFKRLMAILGIANMMNAIRAYALFFDATKRAMADYLSSCDGKAEEAIRRCTTLHDHPKLAPECANGAWRPVLCFYTAWSECSQQHELADLL